jgi:hypothetical protein
VSKTNFEDSIMIHLAGDIGARLYKDSRNGCRWNQIESTACHEASHCVVARHFGRKAVLIEIRSDGGGRMCSSPEMISHPDRGPTDAEKIALACEWSPPDEKPNLVELAKKTEAILRSERRAVERLVAALISRRIGRGAGEWRVVLPYGAIEALLMTPDELRARYENA